MNIAFSTADGAWQLFANGRLAEAAESAAVIVTREPGNVSALSCLAMARWELGGDIEWSIATIQRAVALAPKVSSLLHNLATLQASNGQLADACANFEAAIAARPDDTQAFYGLAQNRKFTEETPLVQQMLRLYSAGVLSRSAQEFLCFALAKIYDDLGMRSRAMHFCIEANWLAGRSYDREGERQRVAGLLEVTGERRSTGHASSAPLFIVGMPRSGTTLVEAILSRHPDVLAGGESERIARINERLTQRDPAKLAHLDRDKLKAEAEQALREMRGSAGASIVTDKTPDNAFRLGLIARLFPKARVVHVRRHPMDCAMSNLFMRFNEGQGFSFRQHDLGERIRQTATVMTHWKQALDLQVLDVSYEMLVAEPEAQSRRLVDFAGLAWDDACLSPEQARRQVQTASQFQVRQKIHSGSVGRFKGYEEWLVPLVDAMGGWDWIETEAADQLKAGAA